MYICRTCGSVFSTPSFSKNGKSECPDCGAAGISEANYCGVCHEYFVGGTNDTYCPDCIANAEDQLRRAVEKWVDQDYIELLKDEYNDIEYILGDNDG